MYIIAFMVSGIWQLRTGPRRLAVPDPFDQQPENDRKFPNCTCYHGEWRHQTDMFREQQYGEAAGQVTETGDHQQDAEYFRYEAGFIGKVSEGKKPEPPEYFRNTIPMFI